MSIESIVSSALGASNMVDVTRTRSRNSDEEDVVFADVVYRDELGLLSADIMSRIVRAIWERELERGSQAFPVVNLLKAGDRALHPAE